MSNRRTLKEVNKLIRRFQVGLVISATISVLAAISLGYLCYTDTVPSCLSTPNGMLAAGPLLTLVTVIIVAGAGCVFSGGALLELPDRWESGDM